MPGRNACEVTLIHQEDSVSGRELDKAGFGSGIWNFMVKMEKGLRLFALTSRTLHQSKNAVSLAQKVKFSRHYSSAEIAQAIVALFGVLKCT